MKKYQIFYAPQALADIKEAVLYYNSVKPGLGNKFIADYLKIFKAISINPFFASIKYDAIRVASFSRFPFSVHYHIVEEAKQVQILAIFNNWKEPFW